MKKKIFLLFSGRSRSDEMLDTKDYVAQFLKIYEKKLSAIGITDPKIVDTLVAALTLAVHDFSKTIGKGKK